MWGASDSFGRASVMLKRRSDALLAKEAEHNARVRHRRDDQAAEQAAHHGKPGSNAHARNKSSATFNLEGERRSVRREAAEVFKERSRECFRQAGPRILDRRHGHRHQGVQLERVQGLDRTGRAGRPGQMRDFPQIVRPRSHPGRCSHRFQPDSAHQLATRPGPSGLLLLPRPPPTPWMGTMPVPPPLHQLLPNPTPPTGAPWATPSGPSLVVAPARPTPPPTPRLPTATAAPPTTPPTPTSPRASRIPSRTTTSSCRSSTRRTSGRCRAASRSWRRWPSVPRIMPRWAATGIMYHSYETSNLIDSNLEPHYSNLIDSANAPIFGVDRQGRVNVWNQCASRLVGYTPSEVMGHELVKEFITRDYQASVQAVLDRALRGDETANFEFPLMTKAGARVEVLLNATARRNPGGKIIGVVGIGQDITGRIAQEREAPIFGVDIDGKVNVWNQCVPCDLSATPPRRSWATASCRSSSPTISRSPSRPSSRTPHCRQSFAGINKCRLRDSNAPLRPVHLSTTHIIGRRSVLRKGGGGEGPHPLRSFIYRQCQLQFT